MARTHVALIRGINVGRAKRIAMADLRAVAEDLGFRDCRTLLNSGNLVFEGGGAARRIAARIQRAIETELGVAANVLVLTAPDFTIVVRDNPLPQVADDPSRVLVAFVQEAADLAPLKALQKERWAPEMLAVGTRAAYLWCPAGIAGNKLFEAVGRAAGTRVTTRNWATVKKIEAML